MASLITQTDIGIIGAGPQALTLVTHLLQKKKQWRSRFIVIDPQGEWLSQWRQQFKALEIPHLRSPAVHHPDPYPYALRSFAENRPDELFDPYDLPGTKLFEDFCAEVVKNWGLENSIYQAKVVKIVPIKGKFQLFLSDNNIITTSRVVLATNQGETQIPPWVNKIETKYPQDRLAYARQINLANLKLKGERILIIGGGLTSGHLAVGGINRGAKITLMTRRNLQVKLFDADPGWLGPKYLKGFEAESNWNHRWEMIQQARNGGSITPKILGELRRSNNIEFWENCEVREAKWEENRWRVICTNDLEKDFDRIWLATGTKFNAQENPLLTEVLQTYPTEIIQGLPVIDKYLRLPKSEFYLMGALAGLQIGPVARNLAGGRKASEMIVQGMTKHSYNLARQVKSDNARIDSLQLGII